MPEIEKISESMPCPGCSTVISQHAYQCPQCGRPLKKFSSIIWTLFQIFSVIVSFICLYCLFSFAYDVHLVLANKKEIIMNEDRLAALVSLIVAVQMVAWYAVCRNIKKVLVGISAPKKR